VKTSNLTWNIEHYLRHRGSTQPTIEERTSGDELSYKTRYRTMNMRNDSAREIELNASTAKTGLKAVGDRLQTPCYLSRGDHGKTVRSRKQRTDIGKYSSVNRTIQLWNQLPEDALGALSCRPNSFRERVRKVINRDK
jgi:hypothetical protein